MTQGKFITILRRRGYLINLSDYCCEYREQDPLSRRGWGRSSELGRLQDAHQQCGPQVMAAAMGAPGGGGRVK